MNGRFVKAIGSFHRGQKGITGLETAIILIAFVTVAAVLAYSVLSAGIFSSERGKEAVYQGLATAQATMKVTSNVYSTCDNITVIPASDRIAGNITFQLSSVLQNQNVDLGKCVVNIMTVTGGANLQIQDTNPLATQGIVTGIGNLSDGLLAPNAVVPITVDVSDYNIKAYQEFTIEIIPPTGATIQIRRTMPGAIEAIMNLY